MASVPVGQVISTESMADPAIARNVSQGQSVGFAPVAGHDAEAERALLGRHAHYECWKKENLPALALRHASAGSGHRLCHG